VLVLLALVDERFSVGEPILLVDLGRALDDDVKEAMTMQVKMDHEGEFLGAVTERPRTSDHDRLLVRSGASGKAWCLCAVDGVGWLMKTREARDLLAMWPGLVRAV